MTTTNGIEAAWQRAYIARTVDRLGLSTSSALADRVACILDGRAVDALRDANVRADDDQECEIPHDHRRQHGIFFTPPALAERIARRAVDTTSRGIAADISCGDGALLHAVASRAPAVELFGVERELVFAVTAAERLLSLRTDQNRSPADRIVWGDGLAAREDLKGTVAAVVGNPPYVGEKGNRELFASVRAAHPDLARFFAARIDLHYLFLHRALDILEPDGRLVYLTSEYWLTATGAATLRADLTARAVPTRLDALGRGEFDEAPGHHSLLFEARRRPTSARSAAGCPAGGSPWHPFATVERADGVPMAELAQDRQGFVSGADRVTRRHQKYVAADVGAPIFLYRDEEVPASDRQLFRPLIRRSDCEPNAVFVDPPGTDWVLWADGTEEGETRERLQAMLEPFRPILERRREALSGAMPWYRIWWPRSTAEYAQPKLVVPRRAKAPAFCLDLSGCHVSSDCTFLLAPEGVEPVPWLLAVMLVSNSAQAAEQLRAFGKSKGDILEFYSEPLRNWLLPIEDVGGRIVPTDAALRERLQALVDVYA